MSRRLWNIKTKNLIPYIPGEQTGAPVMKLNTNENPYPPSPEVMNAIVQMTGEQLRKYPDPTGSMLRKTIADYYHLTRDNVFLGNGSDEVLALAFQAFYDRSVPIAFPDITYSFYPVYANAYDIPFTRIPLREDFTLDIKQLCDFDGGVVLANPNAPTGIYTPKEEIEALLRANSERVVIVDEAYIDFGGESCADLVCRFDHLLVVQTLSKSRSLAGLRVGFALGDPSLIAALECVRDSFNSYTMDAIALTAAQKAYEDGQWFEETRSKIIEAREYLTNGLDELEFTVLPSKANFVFVSHPSFPAVSLYEQLKKNGILVRYFDAERINGFLRITVGTMRQMHELLRIIRQIIDKESTP